MIVYSSDAYEKYAKDIEHMYYSQSYDQLCCTSNELPERRLNLVNWVPRISINSLKLRHRAHLAISLCTSDILEVMLITNAIQVLGTRQCSI